MASPSRHNARSAIRFNVFTLVIEFEAVIGFGSGRPCIRGSARMSTMAATAQAADRVDYWVRRHLFYESHPCQNQNKLASAWDKRFVISAIGQRLKDQYDGRAMPMSPRLAALVRQLEAHW